MRLLLILVLASAGALAAEHPHLLFSSSDIPAMQARIKAGGVPARAYDLLLKRCGQHLKLKAVSAEIVKGQLLDTRLDALSELALAWRLSGKKEYLDALERLLADARGRRVRLTQTGYHVPYIFDWAYSGLSEDSRTYLKNLLLEELKTNPKMNRFPVFSIFGNWGYFMYMPYSIRYRAVLKGHPEFDQAGLDRAAKAMKILLTHAVVPGGSPTEHGAYINYPMGVNGAAILMLERKGYDTVKDTNLTRIGDWMLLETSAAQPLRFFPLADCNHQEPSLFMLRLFHCLMPDSVSIRELLRRCQAEKEPSPDPLSGLVFRREPGSAAFPGDLPKSAFYPELNLLLYRSDWSGKAFQFGSEAIVSRGHSHSDVGSFVLFSGGALRVTDPGYGVKSGLRHNIVTIGGTAPSEHGGAGQVNAQITGKFAVLFAVDAFDAWNSSVVYSARRKAAAQVEKAERTFAVMPPDPAAGIPAYLVISDSVRAIRKDPEYEFRLQQEAFNTIRLDKDSARIAIPTASPVKLRDLKTELKTAEAGQYNIYLLAAGKSKISAEIGGKTFPPVRFSTSLPYRYSWQCVAKNVSLEAGTHPVRLRAESGLNAVRVAAAAQPPRFGSSEDIGTALAPKAVSTSVWFALPEKVSLKVTDAPAKQSFQDVRTLIAESSSGDFLTVILPDPVLPVRKKLGSWYGFTHALEWKNAVDFLAVARPPKSPASPLEPQLKMVRISRRDRAAFPKKLPDDLRYLLAGGGELKAGDAVLFEAKDAGGDRQMITYPRVAVLAWAVNDSEVLRTELRLERRSGAFPRKISVKAFAPLAKKVYCNGREIPFRKNGRYVTFTAMPEEPRQAGAWQKRESTRFTETF